MSAPTNHSTPMSQALTQISIPTPQEGKQYWRSLEELSRTSEFKNWVGQEFPGGTELLEGSSRRNVLKIMAASFGLAGLTACRRPVERILPIAKGVEDYIPGKAYFYSTVFVHQGEATGLLVETHDGRPTKIEGNPDHPFSKGATSAFAQASVLGLYDPDRSHQVLKQGRPSSWEDFVKFSTEEFSSQKLGQGEGLRFLSGRIVSPSYQAVKAAALKKYPKAKWIEYEPFVNDAALEGSRIAFGQPLQTHYAFDKAEVVVALDSDFLGLDSGTTIPIRQFASGRRLAEGSEKMNRLYAVESNYSVTGGAADHRLRLRSSEIAAFAADLAAAIDAELSGLKVNGAADDKRGKWLTALAKDLRANKGKSIVIAGPRQPAAVHALVFAVNQALGNLGQTISFTKPTFDTESAGVEALTALTHEINSGAVKQLVLLGGNPVFTAPYDLHLADAIKKVSVSVQVSLDANETAQVAQWHIPEAHYLESWGDARATDGTASIQQPMIEPLRGGKTQAEVAALLTGYSDQRPYDIVRNYWQAQSSGNKETTWREALHNGVIAGTAAAEVKPSLDVAKVKAAASVLPKGEASQFSVTFFPSASVYDGSFANNGWLQELPDPMTKLVWGNAALISMATAKELGVKNGEIVNLKRGNFIVEMPVMIQPGHADRDISVILGYGRQRAGRVGNNVGYNGYPLRTTGAYYIASDITIEKTNGKIEQLATPQGHDSMEGRPLVREASLEEFKRNPKFAEEAVEVPELIQLYPDKTYEQGYQWGMAIDLTTCVGCNACTVACQAENNVPIVGKEEVIRGRHMHWIRMDRYYSGNVEEPEVVTQAVACMQCENAPCENVCPVAATVHSPEGINEMVYNRCVGTRYCMNNCPYKVRRFNFLNWHRDITEVEKMAFNPDVTVRMRGVMEKCTYCVQRVEEKKIAAKVDGRRAIRDGEIQTACEQACPANAIVFGNINDPETRVSKLKKQERNYAMLAELNVRPRTTYLAKVRNPNPELA